MRILVVTGGTQGDIQPALALARGLQAAGHAVRFATQSAYAEQVRGVGLEWADVGGNDPRKVMRDVQAGTVGRSAWHRLRQHLLHRQPPPEAELNRQVELCRGNELVLSATGSVAHAAEAVGVPYGVLALYPTQPTWESPHHLSRLYRSWGGPVNRLTHLAFQQLFWRPDAPWVNGWRKQLGLAPIDWRGPAAWLWHRRVPHFFGYSPIVIPRPADWPAWLHVTGFWFLDTASRFDPSPELQAFLDAGPLPVAFSFGSLVDAKVAELDQIVARTVAATGRRAMVLAGWSSGGRSSLPPEIHLANWVPLPWLLPKVAALVHHGGAGTLSEVLRAGIPSVAVPSSGEQRYWASRMQRLGAAPPSIRRAHLTADSLTAALRAALDQPSMREAAQAASRRLRAEDGVAAAVAAIESEFAHKTSARARE